MSSALEGVAAYKARRQAEEDRRAAAQKPKLPRFNLEKGGDSVVFRFAQEIDFDATNFDESRGLGFVNVEHTCGADTKNGWLNRGNCTIDSQGDCFPCSIVQNRDLSWDERKGWKQKEKFYINVIAGEAREVPFKNAKGEDRSKYFPTDIDRQTGDGTVYLLEQGTYNGIWDDLFNYFVESELSGDTITNKFFKMSRKGSEYNDTSYSLLALNEIPADAKDLDEFELVNIKEDVLQEVPFNEQEAFYYRNISAPKVAAREPVAAGASSEASSEETW